MHCYVVYLPTVIIADRLINSYGLIDWPCSRKQIAFSVMIHDNLFASFPQIIHLHPYPSTQRP